MWNKLLLLGALGLISAVLPGSPASAQATRTFVSGVGDDANPCSRTAPCKTFAGAISKTAAGGEIDALDPGGFGSVTITKSITIDGGGGQVASVLVAGSNGINIIAGATDYVILRNLRFDGLLGNGSNSGAAGLNGINFTSGAQLTVDNCDIFGFNNNGINISLTAQAFTAVRNSTFRNNGANGISTTSTSGFAVVQVVNSSFVGTATFHQGGLNAGSGGAINVFNSTFQDLSYGAQVAAGGILNIDSSFFSSMSNGILTAASTTFPTDVSNNAFYDAGTAFGGAGSYNSTGNNRIGNGTTAGATPGTLAVK